MLPERVDEAMGLLVEPHALERAKVQLTRRPQKEEPMYDGRVPEPVKLVSGSILPMTASIPEPMKLADAILHLHTGSLGYSQEGNYAATIAILPNVSSSQDYCLKQIYPVDMTPSWTASILSAYEFTHSLEHINKTNQHGTPINPTGKNNWLGGTPGLGGFILPENFVYAPSGSQGNDIGPMGLGGTLLVGPNGPYHKNGTRTTFDCSYLFEAGHATSNKMRFEIETKSPYDTFYDFDINFDFVDQVDTEFAFRGTLFAKLITTGEDTFIGLDSAEGQHNQFIDPDINTYRVMTASSTNDGFFRIREIGTEQVISLDHTKQTTGSFNLKWHDVKLEGGKKPQLELFIVYILNHFR